MRGIGLHLFEMVEHLEEVVFDDVDGGWFRGVVFRAEAVGGEAGAFVGTDGLGKAFEEGGMVAGFEEVFWLLRK